MCVHVLPYLSMLRIDIGTNLEWKRITNKLDNNTSASLDFNPKQENAHTNAITLTRMHRNLPEPEPEKSSVCRRIQFQRKQQQISNRTKGETDYGQKGERMLSISALKWPAYAECASTQMEHVSNVHSTAHTRKKSESSLFWCFFLSFRCVWC